MIKDLIAIHLKSDNTKVFKEAHLIKELHAVMGIDPKFISPYNQATGGVERMNPAVLCIIWKVCLRGKALSLCDGSIGNQNDGVNNDWNDVG